MARSNLAFLLGGGEMGARMRALDWSKSPLGPVDAWPQSLCSTVSMLLPSKAQIIVFWGSEFVVVQRCVPSALRRKTSACARSSRRPGMERDLG